MNTYPTTYKTGSMNDPDKVSFEKKKTLVSEYCPNRLKKQCYRCLTKEGCYYDYKCKFSHIGTQQYKEQIEFWYLIALEKQKEKQKELLCLEEQQKQQAKDQEEQEQCLDVIEEEKEQKITSCELELHEATLKMQDKMVSHFLELGFDRITSVKMMDAAMSVAGY